MRTNYGFIMYTQSQDDNVTSDALSRCQENQKNLLLLRPEALIAN